MHRVSHYARNVFSHLLSAHKALIVTGALATAIVGVGASTPAQARGNHLRFHRGYSIQGNWLCYGWSGGAYHCTRNWAIINGSYHSRTSWVPSSGQRSAAVHSTRSTTIHTAPAKPTYSTGAANPGTQGVINEIRAVFGPYAGSALTIARCESGYNPNAYNPTPVGGAHAEGVFQILGTSTWRTTSYASQSPYNAYANIHAAYEIFQRDGYSWREWQCRA